MPAGSACAPPAVSDAPHGSGARAHGQGGGDGARGGGGRFDGGAARGGASALTAAGQHAAARAGKGKKGKGKKGAVAEPSRKERQSCPCDATEPPYSPGPQGKLPAGRVIDEDAATGAESRPSVDIADSARQRLFGELRFQHSCLPVTDKVQRFLEALGESMAEEDKRAAAALLLARRRRPWRHERHSV